MPRTPARWPLLAGRVLLLAVVALLVVSLGTVVADRDEDPTPEAPSAAETAPSATDTARSKARADALSLQKQAAALAGVVPSPDTKTALTDAARMLQRHGRNLAPEASGTSSASGHPTPSASGTSPPSGTPAPTISPSPKPADLPAFVDGLAQSGKSALANAAKTTPGVARALALAGSGQLTAADALADAASLPKPQLPDLPNATDAAQPGSCPTQRPSPSAGEAAEDQPQDVRALRATLAGLQRAVYAYEAAIPRLTGQSASFAPERLEGLHSTFEDGKQLLRSTCGQVPVAEPAYDLPDGFRDDPAASLAALEGELSAMYADLIGLSDGAVRQWAIAVLPRAALAAGQWESFADGQQDPVQTGQQGPPAAGQGESP